MLWLRCATTYGKVLGLSVLKLLLLSRAVRKLKFSIDLCSYLCAKQSNTCFPIVSLVYLSQL